MILKILYLDHMKLGVCTNETHDKLSWVILVINIYGKASYL
ncbi:MAG: hypothetical protein K0R54_5413 [Clostridiaceae bacterium]|jgi:hypothetical protein|nr:hypothetical protein [Clostridiaceae bacterium]